MEGISEVFSGLADNIISVLPLSPFRDVIDELQNIPYLGWLNWFIPVGLILDTMILWLSAIALFYVYSLILRWIKAIR